MLLVEIGLEEQLGVGVLLVYTVMLITVVGIQQMHRGIAHHSNVRAVFRVEDKGVFHIALIAVSVDVDEVGVMCGSKLFTIHFSLFTYMRLSTFALLLHHADAAVEHIVIALPLPTVLQVPLAHVGLVQESVVVHVMVAEIVLIVSQYLRTQLVIEMDVGISIGLHPA